MRCKLNATAENVIAEGSDVSLTEGQPNSERSLNIPIEAAKGSDVRLVAGQPRSNPVSGKVAQPAKRGLSR